ncbi:A/G-specific adenine glycosylase [Magnetovibrio sp.]|uniref:A/G-specific adenine glycosylase n=1 Tax=Magnetovibrio sp. TaxID=2024836 RepID=UPI002F91D8DA
MPQTPSALDLSTALLAWFSRTGRSDLPWRDAPCGARDPYRVWLAEIMLQQTTCAAVIPYFNRFTSQWPDVKALARADTDDVMRAWAGLGYYARARNMVKCAQEVAEHRQGAFPTNEQDLLSLPGIGPYTAAAIAAIAFQGPAAPVDGNVIRVLSRLYAIEDVMPANKRVVGDYAAKMLPPGRSGDFAEALMDLGATLCKPKNPNCAACPWTDACQAHREDRVADFPVKAAKKEKPTRRGWAFWIERADGCILLERRPDKGLLGGMTGFPSTPWQTDAIAAAQAVASLPFAGRWEALEETVRHTFTHFHLELGVIKVSVQDVPGEGLWSAPHDVEKHALPSVMKKISALLL